jgi:cell shape-determining protein MreC
MKRELKSMQILQDENEDLREEVARLKAMSYEERVKEIGEENHRLRRRNGELLIQNTDLQAEIK